MKLILLITASLVYWTTANALEIPGFYGDTKIKNREWHTITFKDEWTDKKSEWAFYAHAFPTDSLQNNERFDTKNAVLGFMIMQNAELPPGKLMGNMFFVADVKDLLAMFTIKIIPDDKKIKVRVDKYNFREIQRVGAIKKSSESNKIYEGTYFLTTCGLINEMAAGNKLLIGLNDETLSVSLKGSNTALRKAIPSCFR